MRFKSLLLFILIFAFRDLYAQPGGGGGLIIGGFYTSSGVKIDSADPKLSVRTFVLKDSSRGAAVESETFAYREYMLRKRYWHYGPYSGMRLPPGYDNYRTQDRQGYPYQRLLVTYNTDTMIVDFIGVVPENGAGHIDVADSIVIKRGYYRYYLHPPTLKQSGPSSNEDFKVVRYGLTPHTLRKLSSYGIFEYDPNVDLSFLQEQRFTPVFYLRRGEASLDFEQWNEGIIDLEKAVRMGLDSGELWQAQYALYIGYANVKRYNESIDMISNAVKRNPTVRNYYMRIEVYTKAGKYKEALRDFDAMLKVANAYERTSMIDEREMYRIRYLHDYGRAKQGIMALIQEIPDDYMKDRMLGTSEYNETYFILGLIEYYSGDRKSAFGHWLKSEELGRSYSSADYSLKHYDSIIAKHPKVPELYLARGIAHVQHSVYGGGGEEAKQELLKSLDDINTAEKLGLTDERINLHRAITLKQQRKYAEALTEIDAAITKNNTDPRLYLWRIEIRRQLNQLPKDTKSDPDFVRYNELMVKWKFRR